jgi:hypothetical protein
MIIFLLSQLYLLFFKTDVDVVIDLPFSPSVKSEITFKQKVELAGTTFLLHQHIVYVHLNQKVQHSCNMYKKAGMIHTLGMVQFLESHSLTVSTSVTLVCLYLRCEHQLSFNKTFTFP